MKKARIFVPLTKVDEEQRLVYGTISQDILDKSGEQMDYDTSKPLFEEWSGDIEKATDGKSKGNVRVMHGLNACGKLTELNFDDVAKSIDVAAKIVDDQEWMKVQEGVYTGFSVGGSYEKKWSETIDGKKVKKYTARPMEVSIVDNPCVPTATFSMIKADGAIEEVEFKVEHDSEEWPEIETVQKTVTDPEIPAVIVPETFNPSNEEVSAKATELAKAAGKEDAAWPEFIEAARADLFKAHNPLAEDQTADDPGAEKKKAKDKTDKTGEKEGDHKPGTKGADNPAAKTTPAGVKQMWNTSDGKAFDKKDEAVAHELALEKSDQRDHGDEDPEKPEGEEEEEAPDQKDLPLADQLKAALSIVGEALTKAETARTEEGDEEEQLPLLADFDRLSKAVGFIEEDADEVLQKSVYGVSRFADVLSSMANLVGSVKNHSDADSPLPDEVKAAVTALSSTFETYAKEQVAKLIANLDDPKGCDYYYCAAKADDADELAKTVGELIDLVKEPADLIREGLVKATTPVESDDDAVPGDLQKVTEERDSLQKAVSEALPMIGELQKRIETLENTPLPRAPRNIIEKDGGNGLLKGTTDTERLAEVAELVRTLGADALATMMIKASHATGGQRLNPVG